MVIINCIANEHVFSFAMYSMVQIMRGTRVWNVKSKSVKNIKW
jgi:hypothetical protein